MEALLMSAKRTNVSLFTWLEALDKLYFAAENVVNKTIGHPRLPDAMVKLRKALKQVHKLQTELEYKE